MRSKGQQAAPSKPVGEVPATDDEIREKYLERAIRELNQLTRDIQSCEHCPRGNLMPVLGSGHPQADIFLLKYIPMPSEIEEGVAFYGRAGSALMKSFKRLGVDPLAVVDDVDAIEVYNPRVAVGRFNEEAARFAAKYRIPAGAGSDAHVVQGLGSARIRMRDFDGPEEFLESLRDADIVRKPANLLYVQALKFLQTKVGARRKS
jgi:PHP domain-containing protein